MIAKRNIRLGILVSLLIVIFLSTLALVLPWWSINTSNEVFIATNSRIVVDYYLNQAIVGIKTIKNETSVVSVQLADLANSPEDARDLAFWISISHYATMLGLGLTCLAFAFVLITPKRTFKKYITIAGYASALTFLIGSVLLMLSFPFAMSKLSKVIPVDIPQTWPSLTAKDIKSFWGATTIEATPDFPDWIIGGNLWIWGGGIGWYFIMVSALIMFLTTWTFSKIVKLEAEGSLSAEGRPIAASLFGVVGGIFIFVNCALVGVNKGPLILLTSPISSIEEITRSNSPFWGRVIFGMRGLIEGYLSLFWLILAVAVIYLSVRLYMEPIRRKIFTPFIILISVMSIVAGGGFIVGMILAIVGGAIGYQWPAPRKNTLFGNIIGVLKFDSSVYGALRENPLLPRALYILLIASFLSGLGCGSYALITEKIVNAQSLNTPFRILLLGEMPLSISMLSPAIIGIGIGFLKWLTLSLILYITIIMSLRDKVALEKIGAVVGLASAPLALQFFMPFFLTSTPYLTLTWPLTLILITNIWSVLTLLVGIRETLETSLGKALGIVCFSEAFYLWMDQKFFAALEIPYNVRLLISPESVVLFMVTLLIVVAVLPLRVFRR
ncbi:MAG: hypothetical protein QXX41_03785 [Nitrososphaerota archaeon]